MARRRGTFTLSSNIELEAGAPLDSRDIVQSKDDLTNGSFPYSYVGMETYVRSEDKKYRLIGDDPTVLNNWVEVGSGSGSEVELVEISEEDYAALTTEEKNDPTKVYFRYEAIGLFKSVQDDPEATAFEGEKLATGRTIESVVDGKLEDRDVGNYSRNLLPLIFDKIKENNKSGSWSDNVYTWNGTTFTLSVNKYGIVTSVICNGNTSNDNYLTLVGWGDWLDDNNEYILTGCPSGGGSESYFLMFGVSGGGSSQSNYYDYGNGTIVNTRQYETVSVCRIYFKSANNIEVKPMLRYANVKEESYQQYIPTNLELYEMIKALQQNNS